MPSLKSIIEDNHTKSGRGFDLIVQFTILLSLISFTLETMPDNSAEFNSFLNGIEVCCIGFFTLEYILRIIVADKPFRFAFSFFGVIDFLAILPFYLSLGFDLRSIRAFRLLQLFQTFKFVRYSKAIERFRKSFLLVKEEIVLFCLITLILLYLSAVGIYHFEHAVQPDKFKSIIHSMWWSVETLTTVGYGDIYPITPGGKVFTFLTLILGLGIVSVPAGLIASAFAKVRRDEEE